MYKTYSEYGQEQVKATNDYVIMSVQNREHRNEIIKKNSIVCIKVGADWCQPCKDVMPEFVRFSQDVGSVCFCAQEDIDNGIGSDFTIKAVPTFLVFFKGRLAYSVSGAETLKDVRNVINQLSNEINQNRQLKTTPPTGHANINGSPLYRQNYGLDPNAELARRG